MCRKCKSLIIASVIVTICSLSPDASMNLKQAVDLYMKNNYDAALKKAEAHIKFNSEDELGKEIKDMIEKTISYGYLKKGFTLMSEGLYKMADSELEKASEYSSDYSLAIEEEYSQYLKQYSKEKAANKILYDLLQQPKPDEIEMYEISRKLRERLADDEYMEKYKEFEKLKMKVTKLEKKSDWSEAVDAVSEYLAEIPDSIDAKLLLTQINRKAAQAFYEQALVLLEQAKVEEAREKAKLSRERDAQWYINSIDSEMEEAAMNIAMGEDEKAKNKLNIVKYLDPGNQAAPIYLQLFDEDMDGFFERSLKLYEEGDYLEASVRFNFFRLRMPEDKLSKLYYHLAAARRYIKEVNLEKVREHLIKALEISPGEVEALDIFDRLQDVMEVMGLTF
ncbi:MAG: hypothetical protein JXJ19_05740 [Elusimicrobia bacterium]|nr:hypothetical protein [Elusimicrobiota bacterium]